MHGFSLWQPVKRDANLKERLNRGDLCKSVSKSDIRHRLKVFLVYPENSKKSWIMHHNRSTHGYTGI